MGCGHVVWMDERSKENEPRENSNNYIVAERVGVYIMTCYILD